MGDGRCSFDHQLTGMNDEETRDVLSMSLMMRLQLHLRREENNDNKRIST